MKPQEEIRKLVDDLIEQELSRYLEVIRKDGSPLLLLSEIIELPYKENKLQKGEQLRPALDILVPHLLLNEDGTEDAQTTKELIEQITKASLFAGTYYEIRDLVYYSFAIPEAVEWIMENDRSISIKVKDISIFRQIIAEHQTFLKNSMKVAKAVQGKKHTIDLLKETANWDASNPKVKEALNILEKETDKKLSYYFSDIPHDSEVDIGGFSYTIFLRIYRQLLFIALYERYYSIANDKSCVITYDEEILVKKFSEGFKLETAIVVKVLRDIASSSRGSLIYAPSRRKYYLLPFSFSLKDGVGAILKQFAHRNSDAFSAECGIIIGNKIVNRTANCFSQYRNFRVLKDVPLTRYGKYLPDIDIIAISYEPSLGFHLYIAELKNNLPATWSKDYLKSIGRKGFVEKGLSQIAKIDDFIKTELGVQLINDICHELFQHLDFKKLFPTGFCILTEYMIVTGQSIGMFYPDQRTTIINDDILYEILNKSDGDTNYIQFHLRHFQKGLDSTYKVISRKELIGEIAIAYDSCHMETILGFYDNQYLSIGQLEKLEKDSLETGYRFIDSHLEEYLKTRKEEKFPKDIIFVIPKEE